MANQSQPISIRLSAEEVEAIQKHPVKCPTCRQPVTNLNTLVRLALRQVLKIDKEENE
jgi:hypothetical protein